MKQQENKQTIIPARRTEYGIDCNFDKCLKWYFKHLSFDLHGNIMKDLRVVLNVWK